MEWNEIEKKFLMISIKYGICTNYLYIIIKNAIMNYKIIII